MNQNHIAAIILGAGKGTRMKSDLPKVMMPVAGKPMINHILDTLKSMQVEKIVTVVSEDGALVKEAVAPYQTAVQKEQLGTGHAVKCAQAELGAFAGTVLVIFGDTPLITAHTFLKAVQKVEEGYAVVVLGFTPDDPARYGRLKMKGTELLEIVEYKDADEAERAIRFCNSGCMGFDGRYLFDILSKIGNENAAHEYYLTDAVAIARHMGLKCTAIEGNSKEVASANTREELALLETFYKERENW
ncbi:NTP transferase domain-containing protein [bacterium]|nr:NTP transferase domain-containing protein [bacterium]MBR2273880.1 NTP transferase domain-containing protein [Alphaproteobacteria bacterium]